MICNVIRYNGSNWRSIGKVAGRIQELSNSSSCEDGGRIKSILIVKYYVTIDQSSLGRDFGRT
jgi:hypothetical protein